MTTAADQKKAQTKYTVFKTDGSGRWALLLAGVEAANGSAAIKKVATDEGNYAACPDRSWTTEPVWVRQREPEIVVGGKPATQGTLDEGLASKLEEIDETVGQRDDLAARR